MRTDAAADMVRGVLERDGAAQQSPVMQALAMLQLKAALYEWALPFLSGDDSPEADDRTRKIAAELLRGHKGEAALRKASGI